MKKFLFITLLFAAGYSKSQCEYYDPFNDSTYKFVECLTVSPFEVKGRVIDNIGFQCVKFKHESSGDIYYEFFLRKGIFGIRIVVFNDKGEEIWSRKN